jgi:DNA replication protein DnaC
METLAGARLDAVFDDCDESLLILGAAGAGKTVMLAELARELLDRAERDTS